MGYNSSQANEMLMGLPSAMAKTAVTMAKKAKMGLGEWIDKKIIENALPKYGMDEAYPGELSGLKPISTEGSNTFLPFVKTKEGYKPKLPGLAADAYNTFIAPNRSMVDPNFNAPEEAVNMGLNLMGGGTMFGKIPAGSIGMLAGRRAKFANLSKLDTAKSMAEQGIDRSQILKDTQWFKAPDGEWKFEIDDSLAKAVDSPNWSRHEIVDQTNLGDVLIHDNLYNSYEDFPKYTMTKEKSPAANIAGGFASWHGADRGIRMNSSGFGPTKSTLDAIAVLEKTPEYKAYSDASFNLSYPNYNEAKLKFELSDVGEQWNRLIMERDKLGNFGKSATLHELQHGIQAREGFAKGGNPREFLKYKEGNRDNFLLKHENKKYAEALKRLINDHVAMGGSAATAMKSEQGKILSDSLMKMQDAMEIDKKQALDLYNRQAGEAEARAVQTRMNMTPEQREARPFWLDYDVPEADQIVRFDNSGTMDMTAQDVLAQEGKGLVPPVKRVAPQDEALRLAQERAALPVEQGGLGLPVDNTPEQRANIMFPNEGYHGSLYDINKFNQNKASTESHAGRGTYITDSPEDASINYANIYGPDVKAKVERNIERDIESRNPIYRLLDRFENENLTPKQQEVLLANTINSDNLGVVYPLRYRADKPIHLDSTNPRSSDAGPFFEYDKEYDDYIETSKAQELGNALKEYEYSGGNRSYIDDILADSTGESVPILDLYNAAKEGSGNMMDDYTGDMISGGVAASDFIKNFGVDQIAHTPKFSNQQLNLGTQHTVAMNPDNIRSRFAAFDPYRKSAAIAAAMGVAAPDLMADEKQKPAKKNIVPPVKKQGK